MPNGPRFQTQHDRVGPKSPEVAGQYGEDIQYGPPPDRIIRQFVSNDRGIIGDDVNYYPTDDSHMHIDARRVIRRPMVPASLAGIPSIDETLYIPAFSVGDPR